MLALLLTTSFLSFAAPNRARVQPETLDARARRAIVDSVANVLAARYVDPDIATKLAAKLRARVAAGAYENVREPAAFGAVLMRDLQDVIPDKHLRISFEPERDYAGGAQQGVVRRVAPGAVAWNRMDPRDSAAIARTNFEIPRVERFPGNVGYLKLDRFVPPDLSRDAIAAAMAVLAGSDAVIIDLRENIGGSPGTVGMLAGYFLPPRPTPLITIYQRASGDTTTHESWADVPGRRLGDVPLYLLTSGNSASAAEMFPYAMQRLKRATIVGERTAGAGNGGTKISVGAGLALFVPLMRVISGPGYERTGVAPDVAVPADSALVVARRLALETLAAKKGDARLDTERAWALELLRAESRPMPAAATLAKLEGRYGATLLRTMRVRDGRLETVGATDHVTRLAAVDDTTFRALEERYRLVHGGDTLIVETLAGTSTRLPRASASSTSSSPSCADLSCLGSEFTNESALREWKLFHEAEGWPDRVKVLAVRPQPGELYIEPRSSGWYADFHGVYLFRDITGDFVATTRLRADRVKGEGLPTADWSLTGLMVRAPRAVTPATWTPNGENWLFITTGVADDVNQALIETKTTQQSVSRLRLHPIRPGWVELRITRRGTVFQLESRQDGEQWVERARFDRPDLPQTLQVGINAYTDWSSTTELQRDPKRFNSTVITNGRPDLGVRVDWIRFARP